MRILWVLVLLCLLVGCSGVDPVVRRDFARYRASQRIVGEAYLRDLSAANDRGLQKRLRASLIEAAGDVSKIDVALGEDAKLRGIYRQTYERIRSTLQAMEIYAVGIEVVLAKLERRRKTEDALAEQGRSLLESAMKKAATGGR